MNAFHEHHERSIRARYQCFDRILLNGLIQPFNSPSERSGSSASTGSSSPSAARCSPTLPISSGIG